MIKQRSTQRLLSLASVILTRLRTKSRVVNAIYEFGLQCVSAAMPRILQGIVGNTAIPMRISTMSITRGQVRKAVTTLKLTFKL